MDIEQHYLNWIGKGKKELASGNLRFHINF